MRKIVELQDPDSRGRAAAIVLPLSEILPKAACTPGISRRARSPPLSPVGTGRRSGTPPLHVDHEELGMPAREDRSLRAEDDLACRSEAADDVVAGMPCQTSRLAAFGGDHINIDISVVTAGERDVPSVRREVRVLLGPGVRCDSPGVRSIGSGHPDVIGVDERDLALGDRRRREQPGVADSRRRRANRDYRQSDRERRS